MVLVNQPGSWSHIYPWLRHAPWHGYTLADFVFPSFVFILGASVYLSAPSPFRILRRTMLLLLAGLLIHAFPYLQSDGSLHERLVDLRLPGVLQRLALVYCCVAFSARYLKPSWIGILVLLTLPGYDWILRNGAALLPLDQTSCSGLGSAEKNLPACVDRWLFGKHIFVRGGYDPEGLLSTWPAFATGWLGYLAGVQLYKKNRLPWWSALLLLAGAIVWPMPVNKVLWTPSFVLLSAALSLILLQLFAPLDRLRSSFWLRSADFFIGAAGRNALLVFIGSALFARIWELLGWRRHIFQLLCLFFEPVRVSLAYAISWVVVWLVVVVWMDRRKLYIRL